MTREAMIEKLKKDIELLREPEYGYIRAGWPRFTALFGRDACIAGWQLIEYDPTLAKNSLETLARLQGKVVHRLREEEPGKIPHEWHPRPEEYKLQLRPLPYYGSVDVTPLFVFLCYLYYEKTTDTKWLEEMWPHIKAALDWCERYGDFDGDILLEYERKTNFGLRHQGWKDSSFNHLNIEQPVELIEPQGYYYVALMCGGELALSLKEPDFADALRRRAMQLRACLISSFWQEDIGYFAIALERSKKPDPRITSNPGHLLFTGILDEEETKREMTVRRLFEPDMYTPYGIRTHAETNPDFNPWSYHMGSIWPHDNWIIAQGLKRYGYIEEYGKIKHALISVYEEFGEIPELYTVVDGQLKRIPVASSPQAWASGALLNMLLED